MAEKTVQVRVKRAISTGGVYYGPGQVATLPESLARACGKDSVEVLTPSPAAEQAVPAADKQVKGDPERTKGE